MSGWFGNAVFEQRFMVLTELILQLQARVGRIESASPELVKAIRLLAECSPEAETEVSQALGGFVAEMSRPLPGGRS